MNTTATAHPYFAAGFGEGPYTFAGCYDLAEATNPDSAANFGNMRGWLADAPKLKAGMGTCACCGHAIMQICIVKTGNGDLYGVGSDCIEKLGSPGLSQGAAAAIALRTKLKARKRRQVKNKADQDARELKTAQAAGFSTWVDYIADHQAKQQAERTKQAHDQAAKVAGRLAPIAHVVEALKAEARNSDFHRSLYEQLTTTGSLSPRQAGYALKPMYGRKTTGADYERAFAALTA